MDAHSMSWSLLAAAFGVGVVHTLLGPDHYLPFIMLARARAFTPSSVPTTICRSSCSPALVVGAVCGRWR